MGNNFDYEWAVVRRHELPGAIHRGPFKTKEEAQGWIDDAVADGFHPEAFYLAMRRVTHWMRAYA